MKRGIELGVGGSARRGDFTYIFDKEKQNVKK
jgi:hypothetical protein